jgi:hypothetical protein
MALVALLLLGGCSTSPTTEEVATFGKAATTIASSYGAASSLKAELETATEVDAATCAYLLGGAIRLPGPSAAESAESQDRAAFVVALIKYSSLLAAATDTKVSTELEASAGGLVAAASAFITSASAAAGAPSDAAAGPALQLASTLGVAAVEARSHREIRTVVAETENAIFAGVTLLITDLEREKRGLRTAYERWRSQRICVLRALRTGHASTGELYRAYADADQMARAYSVRLAVLDTAGSNLAVLMSAHKALLSDEIDIKTSLALLAKVLAQTKALKEALK